MIFIILYNKKILIRNSQFQICSLTKISKYKSKIKIVIIIILKSNLGMILGNARGMGQRINIRIKIFNTVVLKPDLDVDSRQGLNYG